MTCPPWCSKVHAADSRPYVGHHADVGTAGRTAVRLWWAEPKPGSTFRDDGPEVSVFHGVSQFFVAGSDNVRGLAGVLEALGHGELAALLRLAAGADWMQAVALPEQETAHTAESPTCGMWPDGEPKSVRDAADGKGGES